MCGLLVFVDKYDFGLENAMRANIGASGTSDEGLCALGDGKFNASNADATGTRRRKEPDDRGPNHYLMLSKYRRDGRGMADAVRLLRWLLVMRAS